MSFLSNIIKNVNRKRKRIKEREVSTFNIPLDVIPTKECHIHMTEGNAHLFRMCDFHITLEDTISDLDVDFAEGEIVLKGSEENIIKGLQFIDQHFKKPFISDLLYYDSQVLNWLQQEHVFYNILSMFHNENIRASYDVGENFVALYALSKDDLNQATHLLKKNVSTG